MQNNTMQQSDSQPTGNSQPTMHNASPQEEKKIDSYASALINVVYSRETSPAVIGMLESGDPLQAIPAAVLQINSLVEESARRKGNPPSLGVLLNSNILLTKELIEVGDAGGFFQVSGEDIPKILESTISKYIENGLANKTIDPIELQKEVEPLMSEEQRAAGLQAGAVTGVPAQAGIEAAMETYAGQAVERERSKLSTKTAGALSQASRGGQ